MSPNTESSGHNLLNRERVANLYFMEHRAKLIDIAAFLDRYDRASDADSSEDFRVEALIQACEILGDGKAQRAKRVLEIFSDFSSDITQSAEGMKGASGTLDLSKVTSPHPAAKSDEQESK